MANTKHEIESIAGKRFYKLFVLSAHRVNIGKKSDIVCSCICDCGNNKDISYYSLIRNTKSCGCHRRAVIGMKSKTHGLAKTVEYRAWKAMKNRCYRVCGDDYAEYGARGIIVCDRWLKSFENFFVDVGERPTKKHSLDRIDNNGNYEPSNCKWSTKKEQARNRRTNIIIEYNGKKMCLMDWAINLGVNYRILYKRIRRYKWSINDAFNAPKINSKQARIKWQLSK